MAVSTAVGVCACEFHSSLHKPAGDLLHPAQHHDKILHPSHYPPTYPLPSIPTSSLSPQTLCPLTATPQIQQIQEIISVAAASLFAVAQKNMPPSPFCHASIVYNSDCLGEAMVEMYLLHAFTPSISTARPGGSVRGWQWFRRQVYGNSTRIKNPMRAGRRLCSGTHMWAPAMSTL